MPATSFEDAFAEMTSDHLTLRRNGYSQRMVVTPRMVNGTPFCFESFLDDDRRLIVSSSDRLPCHLSAPVTLLEVCREIWIGRLLLEPFSRRRANIVRSIYVIDRLSARLIRRAVACRGTRYLKLGVAREIVSVAQQIANASFDVDGTAEEAALEEAWARIIAKLGAASCPLAA
jgi:hypothetical protein